MTQAIQTQWGEFDLKFMKAIKAGYDKAVASGAETFVADGHEWLTRFAKYLLEYAKDQGMKL